MYYYIIIYSVQTTNSYIYIHFKSVNCILIHKNSFRINVITQAGRLYMDFIGVYLSNYRFFIIFYDISIYRSISQDI